MGASETGVGHTVLGILIATRRTRLPAHAVHGCPLATCGSPELWYLGKQRAAVRRTIAIGDTWMPSGHVCTPRTDAPWPHADRPTPYVRPARSARRAMAALWPHARACCPPVVKVAALTRRAHPLKTTGAMPGKSLEVHRCDITRPLPLRTIVSCLSSPQCLRRMLPATEPSHSMLSVREVGAWRGMEAAAARRATSLRSELTLRYC